MQQTNGVAYKRYGVIVEAVAPLPPTTDTQQEQARPPTADLSSSSYLQLEGGKGLAKNHQSKQKKYNNQQVDTAVVASNCRCSLLFWGEQS